MIAPTMMIAAIGGGVMLGVLSKFLHHRPSAGYRQDFTKLHTMNSMSMEPVYTSGRGESWHCASKPLDPANPHPYRLIGSLLKIPLVPGTKQLQLFERQLGQTTLYQALDPQTNMREQFTAQEVCNSDMGCRESSAQKDPWDEEKPETRHLTDGDHIRLSMMSGTFQVRRDPSHFFGY
jgi:hypothetical protein